MERKNIPTEELSIEIIESLVKTFKNTTHRGMRRKTLGIHSQLCLTFGVDMK